MAQTINALSNQPAHPIDHHELWRKPSARFTIILVTSSLPLPGVLVSSAWLTEHLDHDALNIVDLRWYIDGRSGEAAYDAGHIPGAVFIDLDIELAGDRHAGPGRHPLPSPSVFAATMERHGIGDNATVVVYDDAGGSIAARLWWMLTALGRSVAVLDGGISSWMGELSIDLPAERENVTFSEQPWPIDSIVDANAVDTLRRQEDVVILDARSSDRFRGEPNPVDKRLGHIPGATSAPWIDNIDPATGRLRSISELRERFTRLGVRPERTVIHHCGSGVTACHNLLAIAVAKLGNGRLYPGSWSDWSADPGRPVTVEERASTP
jgi:thiosulfate/3-mercaptopyruvate sulfurtransferase